MGITSIPRSGNYGCALDLLGRDCDLKKAESFVEQMSVVLPAGRIWGSLLTASRKHRNIEAAKFAVKNALSLAHNNTSHCVLCFALKYVCCAGRKEDLQQKRSLMNSGEVEEDRRRQEKDNGTRRIHSFIDHDNSMKIQAST